ncbi:3'-5' exonuclease [Roseateles violae]|uniref:DNA 3'-5' helicase n=1 Tax=Roseateles violae TaxID=3058042 RepID=A0ABT8DZN9_9BURK|nr:ATP-dependent helicase [Pelomonas sp. PFR6]MDN3923066.1 ATP-dependent helicase [Pelomonas sp. PFR6]
MSEAIFEPAQIAPSAEQLAIQLTRARHVLVEANAGAAKTTTLALRIAQALWRGAEPAMILALTYTAPAVQALRTQLRLIGLAPEQIAALRIASFEAFSTALLEAIEGPGTLQLTSLEQVRPYVLRAIERAQSWPEERHPEELVVAGPSTALVEGLLKSFAVLKGRMAIEQLDADSTPSPALAEELGVDYLTLRVRGAYEAIRRGGHPDHPQFRHDGDACYDLARALLREEFVGERSPFALGLALIVVDEMHDTNRAMFTILKALLAHNRRAAFVGVGDRDQVIHSQAGAEAGFMHECFVQEIGAPLRLPLTASHRFGAGLAQAVGALARKPYAAALPLQATELQLLPAESPRVMAQLVARAAQAHLAQSECRELRILLRQPAHSILIERELLKLGIGYGVQGMQAFLQRREILLVRGLQAYVVDDFDGFASKAQRAQMLEALMLFAGAWIESSELRHLDAVSAQRRAIDEAAAQPGWLRDFIEGQVLRNASAFALPRLQAAMEVLRSGDLQAFEQRFMKALDPAGLAGAVLVRRADIEQLRDNIAQLVQLVVGEGEGLDGVFELLHALELAQARLRGNPRVTLSSIEAAKGLEFDHVLIPYLSRGEFVGEGSTAENRNLLYVAMTRARRRLSLAFDPAKPSRYLIEAGLLSN